MASDGLNIQETATGDSQDPFLRTTSESGAKIAICNIHFLCGTAGLGNIDWSAPGVNIKYHFKEWLPVAEGKTSPTVRNYAELIQAKARVTFKDINIALSRPEFWDPETSKNDTLQRWGIAGYDGDTPLDCQVEIGLDRKKRRVSFPPIRCRTIDPQKPEPVHVLSGPEWIDEIGVRGTPQNLKFTQFLSETRTTTRTLFPNTPPPIQEAIAAVSSLIAVSSYFNPQEFGGITWIGILRKRNREAPTITHYAELSSRKITR